jgi:Tol biopolymer transport system component
MRRRVALLTITALVALAPVVGSGPAAHATQPGKNGLITFAADLGLGREIYTIKRDGTGLRQLTELDGDAFSPDFSPDGKRIVFWLADQAIYIMNADGSDLHEVTSPGGQPAFTPDGHHLVYECPGCAGGHSGIFLMRDDGSDAPGLRLSRNPFPGEGDGNPEISPDGVTVTFVRHKVDGELQALFAVKADGTYLRKLVPYRFEVAIKHDWAPDGQHIVITTDADYPARRSPNVATIAATGSDPQMLTTIDRPDVGAFAGSYSPDGRWIVFRIENLRSETFRLLKMRPDGTDRTLIAKLPFAPRGMDWGSRPQY